MLDKSIQAGFTRTSQIHSNGISEDIVNPCIWTHVLHRDFRGHRKSLYWYIGISEDLANLPCGGCSMSSELRDGRTCIPYLGGVRRSISCRVQSPRWLAILC
jgi:hypothetical protein